MNPLQKRLQEIGAQLRHLANHLPRQARSRWAPGSPVPNSNSRERDAIRRRLHSQIEALAHDLNVLPR